MRLEPEALLNALPRDYQPVLRGVGSAYSRPALFRIDFSETAGIRTPTVRPPSSRGEAWTSPPRAWATDCTIDSPSPAPRLIEVLAESASRSVEGSRRNGSNRLRTS